MRSAPLSMRSPVAANVLTDADVRFGAEIGSESTVLLTAALCRFCCRSRRREGRCPRLDFDRQLCRAGCSVGSGLGGATSSPQLRPGAYAAQPPPIATACVG